MDFAAEAGYALAPCPGASSGLRAPVAQLDRVLPSEGRGRTFESSRARQNINGLGHIGLTRFFFRSGPGPDPIVWTVVHARFIGNRHRPAHPASRARWRPGAARRPFLRHGLPLQLPDLFEAFEPRRDHLHSGVGSRMTRLAPGRLSSRHGSDCTARFGDRPLFMPE